MYNILKIMKIFYKIMQIKIKEYRKQKNITQKDLAKLLNNTVKNVVKWENGEIIPDIYILINLASIFEITIDELLGIKPTYNMYLDSMEKDFVLSMRKLTYQQFFSLMQYLAELSAEY